MAENRDNTKLKSYRNLFIQCHRMFGEKKLYDFFFLIIYLYVVI